MKIVTSAVFACVVALAAVFPAALTLDGDETMSSETIVIGTDSPLFEVIDGEWNRSTRDAGFEGSGYLWCRGTEPWRSQPGRTSGSELVRWRFDAPRDGRYNVYAKHVASKPSDRATDAPYAVMHRDGQSVVRVNMADMSLAAKWNLLGTFDFDKEQKAQVILATNADNTVVADAVKFEYAGEPSPQRQRALPEAELYAKFAEKGKVVFAEDFEGGLDNWVFEGPAEVDIRDGRLWVKTIPMPGHVAWIKTEAPAAFRLEFDVTPMSESGFWLVFFCSFLTETNIFEHQKHAREGVFSSYTRNKSFHGYHSSYRRNLAGNCNLRKNPGMQLLSSKGDLGTLEAGKSQHVVLTYKEGHIELAVDGRTFADYTDEEHALGAGHIALRNVYDCETLYDNIVIYDIGGQ